ncbi:MAG TPA: response regulator [Terriglobales bacterium]|nr:response regulator [Terriglobales bacterium]
MARKILLADDSVTAQNMGRKILTDAGYEVVTVNNGSAALKKISETHPDLIVLDVYMPGYSGLEVCQRVKESRDSAQIPVLLTVGKLEPFKQEEARRVRADAFIIKPFEATELLAALGKLEDKLAPPERSRESHSSAATMASFERLVAQSAPKYGDEESGWKARLKIPKGTSVEAGPEPEPAAPMASTSFRDVTEEEPKSLSGTNPPGVPVMERPIPAGIPQDITADEIAAISAAAARVSMGLSVGQEFERMASRAQSAAKESAERTAEAQETKASPASRGATQATGSATASPGVETRPYPAPEMTTPAEITPRESPETSLQESQGQPATQAGPAPQRVEAEAALPAIESSNGNNVYPDSSRISESPAPAANEPAADPATVAVVAAKDGVTTGVGHRWIAEEMAVDAHEAVLALEREMQKAYAAFAAAEHAAAEPYEAAPVDRDDEPTFATMAPPPIGSPVPVAEGSKAEEAERPRDIPPEKEETLAASASFQEIRPTEISPPPAAPFPPPAADAEESRHAVAAFGEPQPFGGFEPQAEAASVPSVFEPTSEAAVPSESSDQRPAEMAAAAAAAWAKDIREPSASEGVLGNDLQNELTESKPSKGLKKEEAKTEPEAKARAAAASADSSSSTDTNLASIVDSMLAELKPKLMAELAKKLEKKKE